MAARAAISRPPSAQSASLSQLAQMQQVAVRRRYNGIIRACWVAGINTMLLAALDSTNKLAVMKSASENAATNDAHAN
jgi:hypothetical protein